MKKIPNIPVAFKDLPDTTPLNSRDVASMFGYKKSCSLYISIKSGFVPLCDVSRKSDFYPSKFRPGSFWKLGTIRKWRELAIAESNKQ